MKVITVLNGHVLIRPRKATPAPAGIDIPESVDKEAQTVGEVLITADLPVCLNGKSSEHFVDTRFMIAAGALVLFSSLSPRKVRHDGEDCLIIHGEDILAVIED